MSLCLTPTIQSINIEKRWHLSLSLEDRLLCLLQWQLAVLCLQEDIPFITVAGSSQMLTVIILHGSSGHSHAFCQSTEMGLFLSSPCLWYLISFVGWWSISVHQGNRDNRMHVYVSCMYVCIHSVIQVQKQ